MSDNPYICLPCEDGLHDMCEDSMCQCPCEQAELDRRNASQPQDDQGDQAPEDSR